MEKYHFEISQELEQMREQFRVLTEKVEKQNIISEKQLRTSMRSKMRSYDFLETWVQIAVLVVGCPMVMLSAHRVGMSEWVLVMTAVYGLLGISLLAIKKVLQDKMLNYKGDLKQFVTGVRTVKRWHIRSGIISVSVILPYFILFFMDYFKAFFARFESINVESLIIAVVYVLFVIAVAICVETRKRRVLDDIIKEIEE
ncbi:MAG: hypothetical protein IKZ08_04380 [Bacteroidales bacterium]|nr:hypothetical protein [Bacteroidales bacterium]MBR5862548.1 hypothetical protein [Bacteroidales bacterium]